MRLPRFFEGSLAVNINLCYLKKVGIKNNNNNKFLSETRKPIIQQYSHLPWSLSWIRIRTAFPFSMKKSMVNKKQASKCIVLCLKNEDHLKLLAETLCGLSIARKCSHCVLSLEQIVADSNFSYQKVWRFLIE